MRREKQVSEEGVSPVIGVMLMIVVTIIIAAVVSAFAGGLASEQKKVPVAQFELRYYAHLADESEGMAGSFTAADTSLYYWDSIPQFMVIMKSGEPLPTSDLKLVTYRDDATGNLQKYEYTYAGNAEQGLYWDLPNHGSEDSWGESGSIIHPGEVYRTNSLTALNNVLGSGAATLLSAGDSFEVNIVHIPTNEIICHQVVTVQ